MPPVIPVDGSEGSDDEFLFGLFMKEKVKEMRSMLSESELRELKSGILGGERAFLNRSQLLSRLVSEFGSIMSVELRSGIADVFEKHCSSMSVNQKKSSLVMLIESLKLFHEHSFCTPVRSSACLNKRKLDSGAASPLKITRPFWRGREFSQKNTGHGTVLFKEPIVDVEERVGSEGMPLDADCFVVKSQKSFISLVDDDEDGVCLTADISPPLGSLDPKPNLNNKSSDVAMMKEVKMKQMMEQMRASAEKMYNEKAFVGSTFIHGSSNPQNLNKFVETSERFPEKYVCRSSLSIGSRKAPQKPHAHDAFGNEVGASTHVVEEEKGVTAGGSPTLSFVSGGAYKNISAVAPNHSQFCPNLSEFLVTPKEIKCYNVVCSLANSQKHSRSVAVDIGSCIVKFFSLGESMAPKHEVCTYVVNCMCRKFFLDERPSISKKHYFFSNVAEFFMGGSKDLAYVERSFRLSAKVLPLPLSNELFFPVLYGGHWFLFVVDLVNKVFLFLDSLHSKNDEFSVLTRGKLIDSFCDVWEKFVMSDVGLSEFRVAYPHVPKQDNKFDCGVFVIKFMEMWNCGFNI